ncbi:MAG: YtxH domain-containing protein [Bacilli bacterium]|nr:YtxH domain-containing protein [Bacilli bacterium]
MSKKGKLGTFIAGAMVGVGLGVLFAPKSGAETRKELKAKIDELVKKVKEIDIDEVRENFMNKIEEIKKELADLDKEKALEIVKEKAELIKDKLDQLLKEAKAKATPVVEKSVSDLRKKTISVLNDTVKKLESAEKDSKKVVKA